jgi:hypothetical protein
MQSDAMDLKNGFCRPFTYLLSVTNSWPGSKGASGRAAQFRREKSRNDSRYEMRDFTWQNDSEAQARYFPGTCLDKDTKKM